MTVTETAVTNAANLAFFMVNIADCSRRQICPDEAAFSVLDLKAYCRGYTYVTETIKMLREKPDPIVISEIFRKSPVWAAFTTRPLTLARHNWRRY